jgi:hypothetical protein
MKRKNLKILLSALASLTAAAPALADDTFASAQAVYAQGDYVAAKVQFLQLIKANPTWQAYYQLANCYVQIKDAKGAVKAYQDCLSLKPPAETKKMCDQALQYLAKNSLAPAPAPPAAAAKPAAPEAAPPGQQAPSPRQQALMAQRERILEEAKKQADAIRAQAKTELEEEQANSNQRYIYPDGTVHTDIDPAVSARIQGDAETRAQRVMDDARRRADSLTSP